ncbi:MAG: M13 family peptidase [Rhodospirillaceae bacterium]|nr:M13 family peptidase [Rhodospirillaceae bacterium]
MGCRLMKFSSLALLTALFAAWPSVAAESLAQADTTTAPRFGSWGFDLLGRDTAAKPGDDFFRFANGTYVDRTEIPPDRVRFGVFDALRKLSEERVHAILEEAAAKGGAKIGEFYKAYMDQARIGALGIVPLEADLAGVRSAKTREDIAALMGDRSGFRRAIFNVGIDADSKDPARYAVELSSDGMGLPDRDYYLKSSFAPIKEKYQAYIAEMLTLAAWPDPAARAAEIVAFESKMAEASWERAALRDRDTTYNPMTESELQSTAAGFDFKRFFAAADLGNVGRFVVADNTAFPKKAAIFSSTPVESLKAWLAFNIVDAAAPVLPERFVTARFEFRDKTLAGQPELAPRWHRAVTATDRALGEDVGQEYVKQHFPPEFKRQMVGLVDNIKTAFGARLERLDWMSPATKQRARKKLARFTVKIAYPDRWRDYNDLKVDPADLYGNVKRARSFDWHYRLARLDKPVDRGEWGMTPQTVNAYYNATLNEIVFPAAILQPPFFDPQADAAINYGAIGGVIGHELSHGFDDQGRKSDDTGRLNDWWTAEDATKFDARAKDLAGQYSAMELLPGENINGQLTLGENIGDLGGLNLALEAFHISLKGKPAPALEGVTGDQRVFLAWAQVWRGKSRDEALRQQLHTDPHSPIMARVNGVVRNIDAWYQAFGVKPGDKLYLAPGDRVRIW